MKPNKKTYLLFVVAMLAMAMVDNVRGVFVPSFKVAFSFSNTAIGILFLVSSLVYMTSSYLTGYALERWNHKVVLRYGAVLAVLGISSIAFTSGVVLFYLGMIAINAGVATIALCVNTTVPQLDVKHKAVLMNGIHFLYGIGATFTQKGTGMLLGFGLYFKEIYIGIGLVFLLLALIANWIPVSEDHHIKKAKVVFSRDQKILLVAFSVALGLYISGELQTANWLVNYLKLGFSLEEASAANITAVFFLVFSLGRLVGGFVVQHFGYLRSVIVSLTIAFVLYFAGLLLGLQGAWIIAFSGIFFAVAYPTTMLAISDYYKFAVAQAAGIIITASSGINMLMGLLVGYLADVFNIQVAMFSLPTALVVSVMLYVWIHRRGVPQ